ncbi:MAG: alpha/beta fold hydrolase [Bacteroidales bacterium]|jgi:alpha-beta hydrolase superfamily lysophospholipase|nr:alpha/beta fold hydrolase [Bacteroidales bacterium]
MKKIFSILLVAALCVFAANAADEKVQVSAEKAAAALDSLAMLPDLPMQTQVVPSNVDKHPLSMAIVKPVGQPKAIVVFSHGMAEHKERYYPFMQYLAKHGYVCEMHDHRGHGGSITKKAGLGDFGTNKVRAISDDLQQMVLYMKEQYPGLPVYLFCHSMGTMVGRMYLQDYDSSIDKIVLCGPPSGGNRKVDFKTRWRNFWAPHKTRSSRSFANMDDGGLQNSWLSVNEDNVRAYNADPLCGYAFTNNGNYNLARMSQEIAKPDWGIDNPNLKIMLIGGENDRAIGSPERFAQLVEFVKSQGYKSVDSKIYLGLKHELLLEVNKEAIWADVMAFYDK